MGSESIKTKIVSKAAAPTSWSACALTLTHVLAYSYFARGRDGINTAVTIVTDLLKS